MNLFRKNIEPRCAYCVKGSQFSDTEVACVKRGIVPAEHHCAAFRYDPLKRIPYRQPRLQKYKPEDFVL